MLMFQALVVNITAKGNINDYDIIIPLERTSNNQPITNTNKPSRSPSKSSSNSISLYYNVNENSLYIINNNNFYTYTIYDDYGDLISNSIGSLNNELIQLPNDCYSGKVVIHTSNYTYEGFF